MNFFYILIMNHKRHRTELRATRAVYSWIVALMCCSGCGDIMGEAILAPTRDSGIPITATGDTGPIRRIPIRFDDNGWISQDENDLGIQGSWHVLLGLGSTIQGTFENGDTVRVEGTVTPPSDGSDFINYFGAKIGFFVCANSPQDVAGFKYYTASSCPYNPSLAEQIVGLSVTIEGNLPTTELRLQLNEKERTEGTYQILYTTNRHTVIFSETKVHWDSSASPFHVEDLDRILFYVASAGGPTTFSFRISRLEILARNL
jgi:hypothetical protein